MMAGPAKGVTAYAAPAHPTPVEITDLESTTTALMVAKVKVPCP